MRPQPASFCILLQRESLLLEIQAIWKTWHFWRKEVKSNILVGLKQIHKWNKKVNCNIYFSANSFSQQFAAVWKCRPCTSHITRTLNFSFIWMFSLSAWKCYLIYKSCSCKLIFLETFSFKTFKSTGGKFFIQDLSTL